MQNLRRVSSLAVVVLLLAGLARAQAGKKSAGPSGSSLAQGMALAQTGHCRKALPMLKNGVIRVADRQLKYHAEMALARCAMSVNDDGTAVETLLSLKREFPHDPEVLFIMTHYYGELANRAAQELAATAPNSYQAQELEAEALESQGKWDDAAALYLKIVQAHPNVPGIHYHLGQALLSGPAAANTDQAKQEFEKELKIDPSNASAEFVLGELARRAGQWDQAIAHFSRASKLDVGFAEAYLALGMSLASAGKYAEAIAPLQSYAKMQPSDPAGHYQLAIAYSRTGNKTAAEREMALQRQAAARQGQTSQDPAAPR